MFELLSRCGDKLGTTIFASHLYCICTGLIDVYHIGKHIKVTIQILMHQNILAMWSQIFVETIQKKRKFSQQNF